MEYCSAIKRDKIGLFVEKWMNLESIIQSEVSQKEETKYISMNICEMCDGRFYESTSLGHSVQIFGQILPWVFL